MTRRALSLALACSMALSPMLSHAAPGDVPAATANDALRDSAETQNRLKSQTQAVGAQVDAVLAEFDRNGITGDDVNVLRAIRGVLGSLSEQQMQQVVDLLQKARSTGDADASRRNVTMAVVGQKTISSQLGDLLKEYRKQQAVYELSGRLEKLADRQNENFKASVDLAKATAGKRPESFKPAEADALRVQQAEQTALKEEVRQAIADLAAMTANPQAAPGRAAEAMQLTKDARLEELARAAAEELASGNVYRAAATERKVRDQLRDLSRMVAPPQDKLTQLETGLAKVDEAIARQAALKDDTARSNVGDPNPEKRQADLVDQTSVSQRDLKDVAPAAAEKLKEAESQMQQARGALSQKQKEPATQKQDAALAALNGAKAELQKEIEKEQAAQQQNDQPKDATAAVQDLVARTKQLKAAQLELTKSSAGIATADAAKVASGKQSELRVSAMALQSDALTDAPESAPYFATATGKMNRAARVLSEPTAVAPDSKAAVAEQQKQVDQALADALTALEKKQKELEAAKSELAKVEQAKEEIARLMQDQQKLTTETAKAAESQNADAPKPQELAKDQGQKADQAKHTQENLPQNQQAQAAMQQAKDAMQQAQDQLAQSKPQDAKAQQQQAMQQMATAQDALSQQAKQLQQQLQQQPDQQSEQRRSMEQLAQAIDKAQKDVNANAEKLPPKADKPKQAKDAGKELEKTQTDLSKLAAEERDQLPADAAKAIDEANLALTEAAAKADANKPGEAKENAQAASDKLEAAKASLAMAMQGLQPGQPEMAQAGPPKPMPGGPPIPGTEPGPPMGPNPDPKGGELSPAGPDGAGPRGNATSGKKFVKLPERDRQALMSTGAAKYPEEYGPAIEQYLRNLSDESQR